MPNILVGTVNASAPTGASVGTTSAELVAANNDRVGLVITNLADGTIYLGLSGNSATINAGIVVLGAGGNWSMEEYNYTNEAIAAVAHSANSQVAIQEFIR